MRAQRLALFLTAATALATLAAPDAHAQRARFHARSRFGVAIFPPGMYVGAGVVGTKILAQSGDTELLDDGAGLSLYTGIQLSPQLALEAGWTGTFHNPLEVDTVFGPDVDFLVLNALTADAKVFFPGGSEGATPYAQGGLGLYLLDSEYFGTQSVGSGFQLGGGIDFHLGANADLGLRALYRGISMGPPDGYEDDTFVSALSAEGNLTLRF